MRRILDAIWSFVEFIVVFYFVIVTLCVLCKNNRGYTQVGPFIFASIHEEDVNNIYDSKIGDLLIVKVKSGINVKADTMDHWKKEILKMKETGVVVLPWFLDVVVVPENIEIQVIDPKSSVILEDL